MTPVMRVALAFLRLAPTEREEFAQFMRGLDGREVALVEKPRRGRPPGSKNKIKPNGEMLPGATFLSGKEMLERQLEGIR